MDRRDAPQSASTEEEARIAETPALFANKVYVSPMLAGPGSPLPRRAGYPARTRRRRAWRCSCSRATSPSCAVCWTGRQAPPKRRASAVRCTERGGGPVDCRRCNSCPARPERAARPMPRSNGLTGPGTLAARDPAPLPNETPPRRSA